MNIIFLDIDGVLNSSPYFKKIHIDGTPHKQLCEFYVKNLSRIYHECGAKIVLSSTWRKLKAESESYQYLIKTLSDYGMIIYSKTDVIDNDRPSEIAKWLGKHTDITNFVIIDDDFEDGYSKYSLDSHFVKTSFFGDSIDKCGLNEDATNLAIEILNSRK